MVTVDFDDGFNRKMCSVDHIIIVVYINDVAIVFRNVPNSYAGVTLVWSIIPIYGVNTDGGKA